MSGIAAPELAGAPGELAEGPDAPPRPPATSAGSPSLELYTPMGSVRLGYVKEGAVVYLIARERAARWPVLVLREGSARVRVGPIRSGGPI
ncbi:MAG: hypothetical protein ACREDE_04570, partial [Thermoplasmata archaeon]